MPSIKTTPAALARRLEGAPLALGVRVGGRGLAFASAIVLARVLGVADYGIYAYSLAWTAILLPVAVLGFNKLLVRHVSTYAERGEGGLIRGLIGYARRVILTTSGGLAALAALVALVAVESAYLAAVLIALAALPIRALTTTAVGVLQALHRPELSFVPVFIVLPLGTIALVAGLDAADVAVGAELAVALSGVAAAAGLAVGALLARRTVAPIVRGAAARSDVASWRRALGPFTGAAILAAASTQIGTLLLGALGDPAEVGVYHAATRLAEPVGIVFLVVTVSTAPTLARLHERGDRRELGSVAGRAARASLLYSLPVGAAVVALQGPLFSVFGPGFEGGGTALTVLVGAQLANALAGSVSNVLLMTGNGAPVVWARGAGLALNLGLCAALIPSLGLTGAAIARAADVVVWNSALAVVVRRRLGIDATAVSRADGSGRPGEDRQ